MKVIADENIPYVREAFAALGDVVTVHGRKIDADTVHNADLLLVRSITKVNETLLKGASVRFVATATIGEDHIDKEYLTRRGIAFSSAPGSNANSVAQYITAALLALAKQYNLSLCEMSLGIVGVGNVGARVAACAKALGMRTVLNDPPLARKTGDTKYRPLKEVLACDIVTLHVPLTKEGEDATYHLANEAFIQTMHPGAILLNSSRGAVADGHAIAQALDSGHLKACVLDVWESEPNIDTDLLRRVFIGTPHIAGYSYDGKVNGTRQIYEAACHYLGVSPTWDPAPLLPNPECPRVEVDGNAPHALYSTVRAVYNILRDDTAMRGIIPVALEKRSTYFDLLRRDYPQRREFFNTRVCVRPHNILLEETLTGLGFVVEP